MNKYIPADKLIAEIERQMNECIGRFGVIHKLPEYRCLKNIHSYITSLQQEQPEVDLEKEIEELWQNWVSPPRNEYAVFNKEEFINIVRHFYELGLNARKEG